MAFDVYPSTLTNPLNIAANTTSPAQSFSERVNIGANLGQFGLFDAMFIRVAILDPNSPCATPSPPEPTVILIADGGTPVEVTAFPTFSPINNSSDTHVADVAYTLEPNGVLQIEVNFQVTGNNWELQIRNNNTTDAREFIWVVADNLPETSQPWIEIPHNLNVDDELSPNKVLTGQSIPVALTVTNKGTGDLTINDTSGVLGGSDFEILSVPGPITPNSCGDITIQFNAPATAGTSTHQYTVGSNDSAATVAMPAASHNRRVDLSGTACKLEVIMVLDASGSMAWLPDGSAEGVAESDMRWGHMKDSAKQFLDLLEDFAGDLGQVGIVLFPDITNGFPLPNPNVPSSAVLQNAIPIPEDVTPIKDGLDLHTPQAGEGAWTTMGHGIGTAMGTAPGSFGQFLSSTNDVDNNLRWLVVMSDGKHNLGPPDPPDFYGPVNDPTSFRGKNIKVIAVSYGDPGSLKWPPDPIQMEALRTESDGEYLDAGPNDIANLFKSFRTAIINGLALDPTEDPRATLTRTVPEIRRSVSILPYDTKVSFCVNWTTFSKERINVQLLTPDCQLITPSIALSDPNIKFHDHERYTIVTFNENYLRNVSEPEKSRDGIWTLIISGDGLQGRDREPIEYEVITQSRLRMTLKLDKPKYYAGDTITLSARLALDGKGIPNASVKVTMTRPGTFAHNWVSQAKVTSTEYANSARILAGSDLTTYAIKSHAIAQKGLRYNEVKNLNTITMTDLSGAGTYSATIEHMTVPGTYTFTVTAVGQTEEGITFKREKRLQLYLDVRPEPQYTLSDIIYTEFFENNRRFIDAKVQVWPRDRFGNIVLIDPQVDPVPILTAKGAKTTGTPTLNLDGSYSQTVRYEEGAKPVIGLKIGGKEIIRNHKLVPIKETDFIGNNDFDFKPGREAETGANRHRDPNVIFGDVTKKDPNEYLSLGANGSITITKEGLRAQGDDDITVFVRPDEDLRSYKVEALRSDTKKWVALGTSRGQTQSFNLGQAGVTEATAIRITDTSGRTRGSEFQVSESPGVSIRGVGFRAAPLGLSGFSVHELDGVGRDYGERLIGSGIVTIRGLANAEPDDFPAGISQAKLLGFRTKARLALKTNTEISPAQGVLDKTVTEILQAAPEQLAAEVNVPVDEIRVLCDQLTNLQLTLDDKCLGRQTLRDLRRGL